MRMNENIEWKLEYYHIERLSNCLLEPLYVVPPFTFDD